MAEQGKYASHLLDKEQGEGVLIKQLEMGEAVMKGVTIKVPVPDLGAQAQHSQAAGGERQPGQAWQQCCGQLLKVSPQNDEVNNLLRLFTLIFKFISGFILQEPQGLGCVRQQHMVPRHQVGHL